VKSVNYQKDNSIKTHPISSNEENEKITLKQVKHDFHITNFMKTVLWQLYSKLMLTGPDWNGYI